MSVRPGNTLPPPRDNYTLADDDLNYQAQPPLGTPYNGQSTTYNTGSLPYNNGQPTYDAGSLPYSNGQPNAYNTGSFPFNNNAQPTYDAGSLPFNNNVQPTFDASSQSSSYYKLPSFTFPSDEEIYGARNGRPQFLSAEELARRRRLAMFTSKFARGKSQQTTEMNGFNPRLFQGHSPHRVGTLMEEEISQAGQVVEKKLRSVFSAEGAKEIGMDTLKGAAACAAIGAVGGAGYGIYNAHRQ